MGCGPCTGSRSKLQKQYSQTNSSTTPSDKPLLKTQLSWNIENKIALQPGRSFGQPIFYKKNEILFLSSFQNHIVITVYNMKTKTYTLHEDEIPCKSFDIQNTQYTYYSKTNSIYFINNNNRITTLDLDTKTVETNDSITIDNNNTAQIQTFKNKIYILGVSDDDKKYNDNFTYVPYDAYKQINNRIQRLQNGFGSRAMSINVTLNKKNYIYIMGGEKEYVLNEQKEPIYAPSDVIWILNTDMVNKSGKMSPNDSKWMKRYLFVSMTSFGVINYKNKYLITFGGFLFFKRENKFAMSNEIHILDLMSTNDNGQWYVLKQRLQSKCGYFALYAEKSDIVHLFGYNGKYYTIKIKDIMNAFNNGRCSKLRLWTEQGKVVVATKSQTIRNMGPKIEDDEVDSD